VGVQKIEQLRKRDGRLVPYEQPKIVAAILQAARAAGIDDRYLAEDLAGVVTLYLERFHDGPPPTSADVRRVVEKVLRETGHAPIARAYVEFSDRPPAPAAPPPGPHLFPAAAVLVEGLGRGEVSPWDRRRIAEALAREARLDPARAEQIAEAVERRIFGLNTSRVSTGEIRAMVNQELMGARGEVLSQIVIGMPKYDLAQLVRPAPTGAGPGGLPDAEVLARRVGEAALQQFALQEIFSPDVCAAHLEGRIHIHRVEQPLKLYWLAVDLEDLKRAGLGPEGPSPLAGPARDARQLTAMIGALVRQSAARVAEAIELPHLNRAYAGLGAEDPTDREVDYLSAELAPPARPGICIGYLPALERPQRGWVEQAEAAMRRIGARLARQPDLTVFVGPQAFRTEADLELVRLACARPPVRFVLDRARRPRPPASRFGTPENGWLCIPQAVTLNLAQALYRGGGEAGLDAQLESAVELAVRAHLDKRRLLKRFLTDAGLGRGLADPAQFRYVVGVCGLAEAVRLACGHDPGEDESAARAAFRILSVLFALIKQAAEVHRLRLSLEEIDGEDAAERFARIDAQIYPAARDVGGRYTPGAHARADAPAGTSERIRVESRFHTLVPSASVTVRASSAADLASQVLKIHAETLAGQVCAR
jgi:ribonucleoside-triphosphate reductase